MPEEQRNGHSSHTELPNMPVFLDLPGEKRELIFVWDFQRLNTPAGTIAVTGWLYDLSSWANSHLDLHGPACLGRVTDLVDILSSKGLRSSNIQGQEEIMMIIGRKKLKKRHYGLQTHFRTDVLLKIRLMELVQINELLRTSGFPSTVLVQASFLRKPGLGEGETGMHPGPAPSLATVSFWTWILPVLQFRHTVESVHRLC